MRSYIGIVWLLATLFTSLSFVNASGPTHSDKPGFVKAKGRHFTLDGKPFRYVGTNAYWLQLLNKKDLNKTLHDMSAIGVKVVRTWYGG
jgi:mannan endo-1,4-beta-mannosidase